MRDREKSTATPPRDRTPFDPVDHALRAAYAVELLPEHRDLLQGLCRAFLTVAREEGRFYIADVEAAGHLRAAGADLRAVAECLYAMAEDSPLSEPLTRFAVGLAPDVVKLADRLQEGLDATLDPAAAVGPDSKLVLMYVPPEEHAKWTAAAGDAPVNAWLRSLAAAALP
jgi:hypothetical protein